MSFPRYESYKDSGIEWIGVLPNHWQTNKIKFSTYVKGRVGWHGLNSNEFNDVGVHLVTGTDFENGFVTWDRCYRISEERYLEDPYIQLRENDLLITKDGTIGKLARVKDSPGRASLNSGIFLVRAKEKAYSEDYLYWVLQSTLFGHFMDLHKVGSTIQHLYQEVFDQFAFPIPPKSEQHLICTFLDRETAKIDALIAEQQRLIELLKEKRQAVMSHAVTKGLNPSVRMKDSGIEWLGEVPKHWEVCAVRRILKRIEQGWSPECISRPAEPEEWGVLKSGCVNRGFFTENENKALPQNLEPLPEYEVKKSDVLMSRASGSSELIGSVALVVQTRPRLMLSDKIFRFHLSDKVQPCYFVALFNSKPLRVQIKLSISGAEGLANNLPQSSIKAFRITLPPLGEQSAIEL